MKSDAVVSNPVTKRPSHSCPRYVCAQVRKLFAAQGWPLHRMTGAYASFNNTQTGTEGFSVRKAGRSKSVAVHYSGAYVNSRTIDVRLDKRLAMMAQARALLTQRGYNIDTESHGLWITCDGYDEGDG